MAAERPHPSLAWYRNEWRFELKRRVFPWVSLRRSAYLEAFCWRYRWVAHHCRGLDLLDVPCGMGWGTSFLRGCRSAFGVDISEEAIAEARHRYARHATFMVGTMSRLPFNDEAFDLVCCLEGIEHVEPAIGEAFLAEAARVLRPRGMLFLSSPHCRDGCHSGNPYHVKEYQPDELRRLLLPRFDIKEVIAREVKTLTVLYLRAQRR